MEANKINVFNTGRLYTEAGQRVAWVLLSTGNVAMVDIDRGILDYVLRVDFQGPFDRAYLALGLDQYDARVMQAYDRGETVPWNNEERSEATGLRDRLTAAAGTCGVVRR